MEQLCTTVFKPAKDRPCFRSSHPVNDVEHVMMSNFLLKKCAACVDGKFWKKIATEGLNISKTSLVACINDMTAIK